MRQPGSQYEKLQLEFESFRESAEQRARDQRSKYAQLEDEHEAAEAELKHLRSIIAASSLQAAGRGTVLNSAAVRLQFHTRKFLKRMRVQREWAEKLKWVKQRRAAQVIQHRWHLHQQHRVRRWQEARQAKDVGTSYDAIMAFESLAEFLRNGKIQFLQRAESHFKAAEECPYRIVAVVGLFDKGKTWLLNKLFGASRQGF